MKHAGADALDQLEPVLEALRGLPMLKEKSRGIFYYKSRAFLHFHEDPAGLFADVRLQGSEFERCDVSGKSGQAGLVKTVTTFLNDQ